MIDYKSKLGRKAKRHLKQEYFVWLTTVDTHNVPQPRPVWFILEDDSLLIYSQPKAFKVRHIALNPDVALHFNTVDPKGEQDVIVLGGRAEIDPQAPPAHQMRAYLRKYREGIKALGATPEQFAGEYSMAIRIQLSSLRGW